MAAGIYNFTIEQGATFTLTLKYKNSDGTPISLAGHAVSMQLRTSISSTTKIIDLTETQGTNDSVINVGGTGSNEIEVIITATDTAAMTFKDAVYDLEIQSGAEVTRLLQGKVRLSKEVTRD